MHTIDVTINSCQWQAKLFLSIQHEDQNLPTDNQRNVRMHGRIQVLKLPQKHSRLRILSFSCDILKSG